MPIFSTLKDLRKDNKLTQIELAEKLNCNRQKIADWERGKSTPSVDDLILLSKTFGVSADYILGLTDTKATDKDVRFICDYTGLSEKSVDAIKSTLTGDLEFSRPYFNHLAENLVFTELALYLERYSYNTMMMDFKGLGKEQNRKNYEKSQLLLFYAQEFIKDCFKEYKKAGDENAHNSKEE